MMIMLGGYSQGLILHELGHVFTYGILGNNEWRSGWMDEGLTDYQTSWAQKLTPQEQIGVPPVPPLLPKGYRVNAVTNGAALSAGQITAAQQQLAEVAGQAQGQAYLDALRDRADVKTYGSLGAGSGNGSGQ